MNQCKLEIFFKFFDIRNEYMGVEIQSGEVRSSMIPSDNSTHCFEQDISLPHTVELEFFGKNQDRDTEIDENGNVVRDKCVIIKDIRLDNIPIDPLYLKRRLSLEHSAGVSNSNYIGFNGTMSLKFDRSNVFHQIMEMKRLGEN
jgi:hypothetical protein